MVHDNRNSQDTAEIDLNMDDSGWLEKVVHDAAELILSDIDTEVGLISPSEVAPSSDTLELSEEDLMSLRLYKSSVAEGLDETTGMYDEGEVEDLMHTSEHWRNRETEEETNRALLFHEEHRDQAMSFCLMRAYHSGQIEVMEMHKDEDAFKIDRKIWGEFKNLIKVSGDPEGGTTTLRLGALNLYIVHHPPFVCIQQHRPLHRASVLDAALGQQACA